MRATAAILAFLAGALCADVTYPPDADALCETDSECAELCPEGTRDLPADHPDYCDGGPQS